MVLIFCICLYLDHNPHLLLLIDDIRTTTN
jgi:hypothetical protein